MPRTAPASAQSLDQRRAAHAYHALTKLREQKPDQQDDCAREAKKLPIRIMASGLGQALAFLEAKSRDKKPGIEHLLETLADWVLIKLEMSPQIKENSVLISLMHSANDAQYLRRVTAEVLAYMQWLNRLFEAEGLPHKHDE